MGLSSIFRCFTNRIPLSCGRWFFVKFKSCLILEQLIFPHLFLSSNLKLFSVQCLTLNINDLLQALNRAQTGKHSLKGPDVDKRNFEKHCKLPQDLFFFVFSLVFFCWNVKSSHSFHTFFRNNYNVINSSNIR